MSKGKEIVTVSDNPLLDIFQSEEDQNETDLLKMSNFFNVYLGNLNNEIETNNLKTVDDSYNYLGQIAATIKTGFDISSMGMLVADTTHWDSKTVDGLKNGLYHIGKSKETAGNFRPAILDEKENLVKFFTLKRFLNPSKILSDISTLAMQSSLNNITMKIDDLEKSVKSSSDFARREALSTKFLNARDRIMQAATSTGTEREKYLDDADKYLTEGLSSVYSDLNAVIMELSKKKAHISLNFVDERLLHIIEDMQMIPRYVGMRVYLFNIRKKNTEVKRIISDYEYQLNKMATQKVNNGKYTALEMIHNYFPYNNSNKDFWLTQPIKMVESLRSYNTLIEYNNENVFYIDLETEVKNNDKR